MKIKKNFLKNRLLHPEGWSLIGDFSLTGKFFRMFGNDRTLKGVVFNVPDIIKIREIKEKQIISEIKSGKIFIYPTDTIYGLGCDANNVSSVNKIKLIKKRDSNNPLSIIAPSIGWIKKNLIIDTDLDKYLPGPYTIILKKKNLNFLSNVSNTDLLGIRIPNNDFTKIIQKTNVPFITTSVNLSGETPITKIPEINKEILEKVDYVIDVGELNGRPSTLIINGKEIKRQI
ncbi:MAG: L-threonylcarbamoyladenylate synthase [Nanoarchaeota archaeon]|nr:L-threonylcarbamoyladenylate synthase [Nanoarchaeota archaeon]